jgi:hypothetical protein
VWRKKRRETKNEIQFPIYSDFNSNNLLFYAAAHNGFRSSTRRGRRWRWSKSQQRGRRRRQLLPLRAGQRRRVFIKSLDAYGIQHGSRQGVGTVSKTRVASGGSDYEGARAADGGDRKDRTEDGDARRTIPADGADQAKRSTGAK